MPKIRRGLGIGGVTIIAALAPAGIAGALQSPTTGQPGTTQGFNCTFTGATTEPGNAGSAPGSAFNESQTNPGTAGGVYAGNGPGSAHAGSTAAVSQYDTACRRLTSP
jgi:hypothetical protein